MRMEDMGQCWAYFFISRDIFIFLWRAPGSAIEIASWQSLAVGLLIKKVWSHGVANLASVVSISNLLFWSS